MVVGGRFTELLWRQLPLLTNWQQNYHSETCRRQAAAQAARNKVKSGVVALDRSVCSRAVNWLISIWPVAVLLLLLQGTYLVYLVF